MTRFVQRSLLVTLAAAGLAVLPARAEVSPEYKLKAAYLFNFAKFVEWPAKAFTDPASPIVIGVLGTDPFGDALDQIIKGRAINGRPLTIRRAQRGAELTSCHLVFISRSEQARLPATLAPFADQATLTVSDADEFLTAGGAIHLVLEDQKVRFAINAGAAERAGLKIAAQLLSLAKVVQLGALKGAD